MPIPSLARIRELFETMASIHQPCVTLGVAMNGRRFNVDEARKISQQVEDDLQLPVVDVLREGPSDWSRPWRPFARRNLASIDVRAASRTRENDRRIPAPRL